MDSERFVVAKVCEEYSILWLAESIKANPAEQETTVFSRKHLPWPADAWRAREHATRLKRTANKKLGKWQCNYDANNFFDVATVRPWPDFTEQMPSAIVSAAPPLFRFITVAANRIPFEITYNLRIVNNSHCCACARKKKKKYWHECRS